MRHINKIIIKQATESRAASSCGSDTDRQELINNYGNEKYLSKWGIEDNIPPPDTQTRDEQKLGTNQASEEIQDHLSADDDNASLVSYNSVRDGTQSKNTTYLPYQVQQPSQDITLWQGYSGNIYFDSVRCRALRINSSKPNKKKTKKERSLSYRSTKSCSPSIEVHAFNNSASSFYSLGSLRISSREDKKKLTPFKNQLQYSKLRKGFVEIEDRRNVHRTHSTPTSLVISGGPMNGKTDPIDSVYRLNTKIRSSSKTKSRDGSSLNDFTSLMGNNTKIHAQVSESVGDVANGEQQGQYGILPQVVQTPGSKDVSEPTPVFIIPFATLDDPVDTDTYYQKTEKRPSIESEKGINKSLQKTVKLVPEITGKPGKPSVIKPDKPAVQKPDKPTTQKTVVQKTTTPVIQKSDKVKTSVQPLEDKPKEHRLQQTIPNAVPTHIVNITGDDNISRVSPRPDLNIRREISNSSLSNYLQAVPQRTKTVVKEQKKSMPKLTYTQRTREICTTEIENKNTFYEQPNGLPRTEALYGGYLPSTRPAKNFHADFLSETASDSSTVTSRQNKHHVTKSIHKRTSLKDNGAEVKGKFHLPVIGWNVS